MDELRNKMMLGALTMGDLHALVRETGILWRDRYREWSLGKNWLPVGEVRKQGSALGFWMEDVGEMPDVSIPLDSVVKVQGDTVTLVLDSDCVNLYTRGDTVELRIRLDFKPFQRSEKSITHPLKRVGL